MTAHYVGLQAQLLASLPGPLRISLAIMTEVAICVVPVAIIVMLIRWRRARFLQKLSHFLEPGEQLQVHFYADREAFRPRGGPAYHFAITDRAIVVLDMSSVSGRLRAVRQRYARNIYLSPLLRPCATPFGLCFSLGADTFYISKRTSRRQVEHADALLAEMIRLHKIGPPPGWYPDPSGSSGTVRYWDGRQWTAHAESAQPGAS